MMAQNRGSRHLLFMQLLNLWGFAQAQLALLLRESESRVYLLYTLQTLVLTPYPNLLLKRLNPVLGLRFWSPRHPWPPTGRALTRGLVPAMPPQPL